MNVMVSLALCSFVLFSCEENERITAIGDTSEEYFAMGYFSGIDISVPAKVTLMRSDKHDVTVETYQNILRWYLLLRLFAHFLHRKKEQKSKVPDLTINSFWTFS